jgi:hypothetical protein
MNLNDDQVDETQTHFTVAVESRSKVMINFPDDGVHIHAPNAEAQQIIHIAPRVQQAVQMLVSPPEDASSNDT